MVFGVNTMTSGKATFITPFINGTLEGIFVKSKESIRLKVTLGDSDVTVFTIQHFQGEEFIPVRLGVVDSHGQSFANVADKWPLNNVLRFEIKGPLNSEARFGVRYT